MLRAIPTSLAAVALILLAGCTAGTSAVPQGAIAFDTLDHGVDSDIEQEHTETITTPSQWAELHQDHATDEDPPPVDFDQSMVLAIFKGESPNACHGAEITNVTGIGEDQILVEGEFYEVDQPACAQVVTYPFHIVQIDRYDAQVEYDIEQTVREGEQQEDNADDQEDENGDQEGPPEGSMTFDTVDRGHDSGIEDERTRTVRTQAAWDELYQEHAPEEQPPEVDFEERMVFAIFKGESPNTCHGAEITDLVGTDADSIRVEGEFYEVSGACAEMIVYPFHIVEADRYDVDVAYDIEQTERSSHEG